MVAAIGSGSLVVAFLLTLFGIAAFIRGHHRRDERWIRGGRNAVFSVFFFVSLAVVMLEIALVRFDFGIAYVANNISLTTPLLFRIITLWGALEGSILLWQWVLALFATLVAAAYRRYPEVIPYVLSVLLGISAFFLMLMLGPADPFLRLDVPPLDGRGLNPLLQNHPLMAVHPPFLYLGYVGFAVPYAFAMGSLLSGRPRDEWISITRRWTLAAWTCLTAGLFLGARWSYDVLGWGGYWGWDPVENAAFLPWLVGTALVHSSMVQARRQLLRIWTLTLIILTFLLTIFGTFLTRSGVLASVHSFTQSLIGPLFLAFLAVTMAFSFGLLLARLGAVRDEGTLSSYLSREAMLVLNNVVLLVMAFTVFFGTVFPLAVEATTGEKITVGPPFFNQMFVPLGVILLILMGAGTVLRWGRAAADEPRRLVMLLVTAALAAAALALAGLRGVLVVIGLGVVAFMALAQLSEFYRGTRGRQAATGERAIRALRMLFASHPQRYYGYLTHLGLAVVTVGIIASMSYRLEAQRILAVGESLQIGSYTLRYDGLERQLQSDRMVIAARVAVFAGGGEAFAATPGHGAPAAVLRPSLNFFPQAPNPVATPGVRSSWRDDLYVVLMGVEDDGRRVIISTIVSPLVAWIWAGGVLMVAAGGLNLWAPRRRP